MKSHATPVEEIRSVDVIEADLNRAVLQFLTQRNADLATLRQQDTYEDTFKDALEALEHINGDGAAHVSKQDLVLISGVFSTKYEELPHALRMQFEEQIKPLIKELYLARDPDTFDRLSLVWRTHVENVVALLNAEKDGVYSQLQPIYNMFNRVDGRSDQARRHKSGETRWDNYYVNLEQVKRIFDTSERWEELPQKILAVHDALVQHEHLEEAEHMLRFMEDYKKIVLPALKAELSNSADRVR